VLLSQVRLGGQRLDVFRSHDGPPFAVKPQLRPGVRESGEGGASCTKMSKLNRWALPCPRTGGVLRTPGIGYHRRGGLAGSAVRDSGRCPCFCPLLRFCVRESPLHHRSWSQNRSLICYIPLGLAWFGALVSHPRWNCVQPCGENVIRCSGRQFFQISEAAGILRLKVRIIKQMIREHQISADGVPDGCPGSGQVGFSAECLETVSRNRRRTLAGRWACVSSEIKWPVSYRPVT
jgi:hypothetical protein